MKGALVAELATPEALVTAIRALRASGVTKIETFTPYDVEEVRDELARPRSKIGWLALAGALFGGGVAYAVQWWINVRDYPLNIAGKPDHAALAFVPITFEMAVLCAAATAFISAIVLGGLPRLWHPMFEVDGFERASIDRFWIAIDLADPALDEVRDKAALLAAGALRIDHAGGAA